MEYRKVGKWGLKISELGFGTWLTFGPQLDVDRSKEIIREAFKNGINFFDTAEAYQGGMAEYILSQALKEFKREDLVVSTKIFWGGSGPNDLGLSRKHLIEGTENSLKRLQMKYVDLVYCHRPDPSVPMEEVVLAMDYIVRSGMALYWGTSEWSAQELEEAHRVCKEWKCVEPIVEQPQYNMLKRERVEKEYLPIYEKYGMGLTTFSPLASGFLTGKYNNGIPKGSRLDLFPDLKKRFEEQGKLSGALVEKVEKLGKVAKDLDIKLSQLAISWVLKNQHVSSVLLGVSNMDQFKENLSVIKSEKKLTEDVMKKIEEIIG
ncbi:MAG: aldo/keto reductase [Athalassotoga sp.]|uniref:aldo/keto reductase n=2 Tax=Athalassotoga sp. TaxID=2022597 RepID=UPI003D03860A